MSLLGMIAGLTQADIRFVVVGGVAAAAHGSTRVTVDLDICFDDAAENREALGRRLATWSAYPREVEPGLPFVMDAQTLRNAELLTLSTTQGALDIVKTVPGVGDYAACLKVSEETRVDDLVFRILSLDALIRAKRAAGRPRDLEHLRELEAIREMRGKGL